MSITHKQQQAVEAAAPLIDLSGNCGSSHPHRPPSHLCGGLGLLATAMDEASASASAVAGGGGLALATTGAAPPLGRTLAGAFNDVCVCIYVYNNNRLHTHPRPYKRKQTHSPTQHNH